MFGDFKNKPRHKNVHLHLLLRSFSEGGFGGDWDSG